MAKITGKTNTGFAFEYDDRILTDWEYVDALANTQNGTDMERTAAYISAVKILVGPDKMADLISHVKGLNDGFAPVQKIADEFMDMIKANENAKN